MKLSYYNEWGEYIIHLNREEMKDLRTIIMSAPLPVKREFFDLQRQIENTIKV